MTETDHSEYLCFTQNTPRDVAIARFLERFHVQPTRVFECYWLLWVGPVPEDGTGND